MTREDTRLATIRIKSLRFDAWIGVTDEEQAAPRPLIVDVWLELDIQAAAASDRLDATIDYRAVRDRIIAATARPFRLLESFAATVLDAAVADSRVLSATVEVHKPNAMRMVEDVSVVTRWSRPS
ncbi:MAG: dihydroneopterin aldolase [Acidobacteria bacterium]|nr:dihydroneopterin aldolase [Acidobacteriota bacterium]